MELIKEFLTKYLELCLEFGIEISACGCCSSPYIIYNEKINAISYKGKHYVKYKEYYVEEIHINYDEEYLEFSYNGKYWKLYKDGKME